MLCQYCCVSNNLQQDQPNPITLISAVGQGHTLPGLVIQPAVAGASLLPPNYHWPLAAVLDDNLS